MQPHRSSSLITVYSIQVSCTSGIV